MLRGIYSSAAGMVTQMDRVFMHAGNISNSQTLGYKKRETTTVPFKELLVNVISDKGSARIDDSSSVLVGGQKAETIKVAVGTGSRASYKMLNTEQGSFKNTGSALNVAIEGEGYFTIGHTDKSGNIYKTSTTRNGSFTLSEQNYLVASDGSYVLDTSNSPIQIPMTGEDAGVLEKRLTINSSGEIYNNGNLLSTLQIQKPTEEQYVIPEAGTIFNKTVATTDLGKTKIKQGFLEQSNVNIIQELIGLMHSSKIYESGHKLIMNEDKILDKSINELGRAG